MKVGAVETRRMCSGSPAPVNVSVRGDHAAISSIVEGAPLQAR